MKKLSFHILVLIFFNMSALAQSKYSLADEKLISKSGELVSLQKLRLYKPSGYNGNLLVYQFDLNKKIGNGYSSEADLKVYYDEKKQMIIDTISVRKKNRNILDFFQINGVTLYHGFYDVPSACSDKLIDELDRGECFQDYQDFWADINGREERIISYPMHYYDKDIYYNLSYDANYFVFDEFVSQYLRSTIADSIIRFIQINNDFVETIPWVCKECIRPQIVNGVIYYGKKFFYFPGTDAYDWKIYRTSSFDSTKEELLAEYIEILLISPDGRFILGKKDLFGRKVAVILDVENKRYDYILGRDYLKYNCFYSFVYNKFAFDTKGYIIYIDYPDKFPFSAIGVDARKNQSKKNENIEFWAKFKYSDLDSL